MRCIANAMGMSFDSLLDMIDSDQPISIKKENAPAPSLTSSESDLLNKYRRLNSEGRKKLVERADELFDLGYVEKGDAEKMA